jgi:antitoxin (DNA-binding transcriptional repressor) of toxin-antitoxin stability system
MARLHIDVTELPAELDYALAHLQRGGEVLLERDGQVVARLASADAKELRRDEPEQGRRLPVMLDPFEPGPPSMDAAISLLRARAAGGTPFDAWDELAREEEFLEMLAAEELGD